VAAQIHGVDVEILAQGAGYPIPVAGVIQAAVDQYERGFAILAPVPEMELEAMGIVIVRDGFQVIYVPRSQGRKSGDTSALWTVARTLR
jgi:hypothetical protein